MTHKRDFANQEPRINFSDESLFGNDAAELETEDIFGSYACVHRDFADFQDPRRPMGIVRAYKGEGKSALLRMLTSHLRSLPQPPVVIATSGPNLSPAGTFSSLDERVRKWKESIIRTISCEIGSAIGFAISDDAITLVEEAERGGFREKNIVSAILDRIKLKGLPERVRPAPPD